MMHRYTDVLHKRFIVSVLVALNQSVGECALWCSSDEWNLLPLLVNNLSLLLFYFYFLGNCTCICLSIYLDCRILLNIASLKRLVTELEKKMSIFLRASITKQLGGLFHECAALNGNISPKKKKNTVATQVFRSGFNKTEITCMTIQTLLRTKHTNPYRQRSVSLKITAIINAVRRQIAHYCIKNLKHAIFSEYKMYRLCCLTDTCLQPIMARNHRPRDRNDAALPREGFI